MRFTIDGRFTMAPETLLYQDGIRGAHSSLSDKAYRLYHVLWSFADRDTQEADTTRSRLASSLGCSTKTVDRALIELETFGAIEKASRYTTSERQTSNLYIVKTTIPPLLAGWTPVSREGDKGVAHEGDLGVAPRGDTRVAPTQEESRHQHSQEQQPPTPVSVDGHTILNLDASTDAIRRWAEVKGVPFTRAVQRRWLPAADEFLTAIRYPDDVDSEMIDAFFRYASTECREPSGWPYWWATWEGASPTQELIDCATCGNTRFVGVDSDGLVVPVDTPDSTILPCSECRTLEQVS